MKTKRTDPPIPEIYSDAAHGAVSISTRAGQIAVLESFERTRQKYKRGVPYVLKMIKDRCEKWDRRCRPFSKATYERLTRDFLRELKSNAAPPAEGTQFGYILSLYYALRQMTASERSGALMPGIGAFFNVGGYLITDFWRVLGRNPYYEIYMRAQSDQTLCVRGIIQFKYEEAGHEITIEETLKRQEGLIKPNDQGEKIISDGVFTPAGDVFIAAMNHAYQNFGGIVTNCPRFMILRQVTEGQTADLSEFVGKTIISIKDRKMVYKENVYLRVRRSPDIVPIFLTLSENNDDDMHIMNRLELHYEEYEGEKYLRENVANPIEA